MSENNTLIEWCELGVERTNVEALSELLQKDEDAVMERMSEARFSRSILSFVQAQVRKSLEKVDAIMITLHCEMQEMNDQEMHAIREEYMKKVKDKCIVLDAWTGQDDGDSDFEEGQECL